MKSKAIQLERAKKVLHQDKNQHVDAQSALNNELYRVISNYINIKPNQLQVKLNSSAKGVVLQVLATADSVASDTVTVSS